MWLWVLLLSAIVFIMYMWMPRMTAPAKAGCNTCGGGKNVPIE